MAVSELKAETDVALQDLRDKFDELAAQFKDAVDRNREASDAIVAMVEDSKQSLNTLMHYQLTRMGLQRNYTQVDLPNAMNILKECHGTLEFICQAILDQSRLRSQRSAFSGLWVGYRPFIEALKVRGLIDDERHRLMGKVADSRRYVRSDSESISLVDLNMVANAADDLKKWFEHRREAPAGAVVASQAGAAAPNGGIALGH